MRTNWNFGLVLLSLLGCMGLAVGENFLYADGAAANNEPQAGVIDLGQMSVNGELRKPSVTWIDSQKAVKDLIHAYLKPEFDAFESKLLEPAQIPSNEKETDAHVKN